MKTPFSRNHQHEIKLQTILSEAARLFNFQGTRATTLGDIATRIGLTKTSLYYYARNKSELVPKQIGTGVQVLPGQLRCR
jgi:AcrR family transcriptional regulator